MKKLLFLLLIGSNVIFSASDKQFTDEKKHELLIKMFFDQYICGPRKDGRGPQECDLETCYATIKDYYWLFYESLRTTQPQEVMERAQAFARIRSAFDVEAAKKSAAATVRAGNAESMDAPQLIGALLQYKFHNAYGQQRAQYAVLKVEQMYALRNNLAVPALTQEQFHAHCLPLLKKAWIAGGQQIQKAECQELHSLLQEMGLKEIALKRDLLVQATQAYQQEGCTMFNKAIGEIGSYNSL